MAPPCAYAGAAAALVALSLLTTGCATTPQPKVPVPASGGTSGAAAALGRSGDMVSGESSGLGISGQQTPAALLAILTAPYIVPAAPDCAVMATEIGRLDEVLGPDVDAPSAARGGLGPAAGQAMGSAVRGAIPYRWVLRWMTQADRQDRALRQAILAGTARRSFLKGVRQGLGCQPLSMVASR